jgi:radical SAM superfamily enzyme YgiQ (UPF0313 family)
MRILALQFLPAVEGRTAARFEPALATLLSLLKQRGHELSLRGVSRFDPVSLKSAMARALPQLVYADISPVCVGAARRTLERIRETEFLPVIAGGAFATLDPAVALSLPGVQAVAVGEPDASLVTYLERSRDPAVGQVVQGVWTRDERGQVRPQLPHLVEDLDSLPLPERDLFDYGAQLERTGELEIAIGRGCPQACGYCINPPMAGLYAGRGAWTRRRSPGSILAEIAQLRARYAAARSVRFLDHSFALDEDWLRGFLGAYEAPDALPFRCHVRCNAATRATIQDLARAGCRRVDVELISGSDFIRNEILHMELSAAQIDETFARLREAGIAVRATVYLGAPYESEMSLEETRLLLRRLRPDWVDVRPYYPWPGTAAEATARENGWLHARGEEQFHSDRPGIDMPACRPRVVTDFVKRLRSEFASETGASWWRRWSRGPALALGQLWRREQG